MVVTSVAGEGDTHAVSEDTTLSELQASLPAGVLQQMGKVFTKGLTDCRLREGELVYVSHEGGFGYGEDGVGPHPHGSTLGLVVRPPVVAPPGGLLNHTDYKGAFYKNPDSHDPETADTGHGNTDSLYVVNLLTDWEEDEASVYVHHTHVVPLQMCPKISVIVGIATEPGIREMTFGVPIFPSAELEAFGGGDFYLTAKSNAKFQTKDAFLKQSWQFESGSMLNFAEGHLVPHNSSDEGRDFCKEANRNRQPNIGKEGKGGLVLVGFRLLTIHEPQGDHPDDKGGPVVNAYVTTPKDLDVFKKCLLDGSDVSGPKGPRVYEVSFLHLVYGEEEEVYSDSRILMEVVRLLVQSTSFGAPATLDMALHQGGLLRPFTAGIKRTKASKIQFSREVSSFGLSHKPTCTLSSFLFHSHLYDPTL
jgi:hypothetical protein